MRVLVLTQIIPYPPNAGPRVKTWHVLRYLVDQGHDVTLLSYVRQDELDYVPVLEQLCAAVHTVPIQRSKVRDVAYWIKSNITGRPFLIERDDLPEMRELVRSLLLNELFDVIHADQLTMTQFALEARQVIASKQPFIIFDAHNATWTIWERMRDTAAWFLKPVYRLEMDRIKKYEAMLTEQFDHTMVVIEQDKEALLQGNPNGLTTKIAQRISTIPIAVDTIELQPVQRQPESRNIMTLGSLHYPPNADGIRWFMNDVFPLIQKEVTDVTLTVIGKNPPSDFSQLADQSEGKIIITGYVPDLTPYMETATLMVVPVRAGSGMRVRLLEAFARAMPAVTTTIGLEGIDAKHGREIIVADDPLSFARATVDLLCDTRLQNQLAGNGRLLAETQYDWRVVLKKMDAVYNEAEGKS